MAYTPELCSGIVFRTTPTYDTPAYRFGMSHPKIGGLVHVGTKVSGLVALVVDTQTGLRRYCDLREDACYPADAIQLLNCSVSHQSRRDTILFRDSILLYDAILNRSATSQTKLRTSDVEETLV